MIVIDTSAILAYMNSADDHHELVRRWLLDVDDDLVTTPLIIAETDHLVTSRGGLAAARAWRADLAVGAYVVDWWPQALSTSVRIAERYADMPLGLADASLVALAEHHSTISVATLDERHFRTVRPLAAGTAFRLLPQDA